MAARHRHHMHHKAKGGRTTYAGAGSHVEKEAEATGDNFRHGGHAHHHEEHEKHKTHKRHGRGHHHHGHHAEGGAVAAAGGAGFKRGGRTGSNHSPFSSAAHSIDMGRTTHNVPKDELNAGAGGHKHGGKAHHGKHHHGHHGHK